MDDYNSSFEMRAGLLLGTVQPPDATLDPTIRPSDRYRLGGGSGGDEEDETLADSDQSRSADDYDLDDDDENDQDVQEFAPLLKR